MSVERNNSDKAPWYVVAVSMIGTSLSGVSFISVPGMVEASAFTYLQMVLGFVAGYFAIAYILLPVYYKLELQSIYGYLGQRFGQSSYLSGAWFFFISKMLGCGVRIYLTALVMQVLLWDRLGVPFAANAVITMGLIWLYSRRGGVHRLIWTDMVQTLAMLTTVILCIVFTARALSLHIGDIPAFVRDSGMGRIFNFSNPTATDFFWKQFLAGMCTTIAMTGLDQDMMQKNLRCRNIREAQKNVISYGFGFLPVNIMFLTLGVLLYGYGRRLGVLEGLKPDEVFPVLATQYLPDFVGVIFFIGLLLATFTSAGSALRALTTAMDHDILRDSGKACDSDRHDKRQSRIHLCNALIMTVLIISLQVIGSNSVINAVYTLASYTYGPLLGLYAFGLATKRAVNDRLVPYVCIASPLLCLALTLSSKALWGYTFGFEVLLINAAFTFAGLALIKRK